MSLSMNSDFNWDLYKIFHTVAECSSFSKAAEKLFITQPSISYSIKQLEESLGTKLFYRVPSGAKLTPDGVELLEYVKKSYSIILSGERNLKESKDLKHGRISVGVQSHIGEFFLFPFIEQFHKKHKNIIIDIVSRNTEEMINLMEKNQIDFMIDTSPINSIYNNLTIEPLLELENCFICNKDLKEEVNCLKDLEDKNLILPVIRSTPRKELIKCCDKYGVTLNPFMTIETTEMLIQAIKKDMGIGYVLKSAVKADIKEKTLYEVKVKEKLPTIGLNIVYVKDYLTHVPVEFIKEIQEEFKE